MASNSRPGKYKGGRKERPLTLLSGQEEERIRGEIAEDQRYLNAVRGRDRVSSDDNPEAYLSPGKIGREVDTSSIEARVRRKQNALAKLSPRSHRLAGVERQRACVEMKGHEEFFRKNMLTTRDMGFYPKAGDHERHQDYMRACEKSFAQEVGNPEFQRRAHRYKELARRLDPDNPDLPNLERFRPAVRTGGRMRRY